MVNVVDRNRRCNTYPTIPFYNSVPWFIKDYIFLRTVTRPFFFFYNLLRAFGGTWIKDFSCANIEIRRKIYFDLNVSLCYNESGSSQTEVS